MTSFKYFSDNNTYELGKTISKFFQQPSSSQDRILSQTFYNTNFTRQNTEDFKTNFNSIKPQDEMFTKPSDLQIMHDPVERNPWPNDRDQTSYDKPEDTSPNVETNVTMETEETSTSMNLDFLPEYTPVVGLVGGTLNNSIMNALTTQNYTKTMQGNSSSQGSFNAQRTAQLTEDNRNIATGVSSTIMSASALLGPEAFIAGTVIGAGIDVATELGAFDSAPAPVNSN